MKDSFIHNNAVSGGQGSENNNFAGKLHLSFGFLSTSLKKAQRC